MFGGLFGRKKEKTVRRKDPVQKKAEAMALLNKLQLKLETDEARIEHLTEEMKHLKRKMMAEKKKKKPDKRVLMRHLNSLKLKEKQVATYDSYLLSTTKQINSIQVQMGAADTVSLMKQSAAHIRENQIDAEDVDEVLADVIEQTDNLDEVNNLIAEHGSTGVEEEDVMDEVDQWLEGESEEEDEDEEVDVDLPQPQAAAAAPAPALPTVPTTALPAVAAAPAAAAAPAPAPARVAVAVGSGGGGAAADDEADLAAWFN